MNNLSRNNQLLIGVAVLVLVLIGVWFMMGNSAITPGDSSAEGNEMEDSSTAPIDVANTPSTTSDTDAISISNQSAGESVIVSSATFSQSGWIAVRDDGGWTLGARRLDEGVHSNVEVRLLRSTEVGKRYQVLLYIDDGDKQFDLDSEILITRSDGSVAGAMFTAE